MSYGEIQVFHLSGLINGRRRGVVRIGDEGVQFYYKDHRKIRHEDADWSRVESIRFDDPGRTRANVGALAVFGVLAIGSRRSFSLLTIAVNGRQAYFETQEPIGTWRAYAPQIIADVPAAAGKLYVDGVAVAR